MLVTPDWIDQKTETAVRALAPCFCRSIGGRRKHRASEAAPLSATGIGGNLPLREVSAIHPQIALARVAETACRRRTLQMLDRSRSNLSQARACEARRRVFRTAKARAGASAPIPARERGRMRGVSARRLDQSVEEAGGNTSRPAWRACATRARSRILRPARRASSPETALPAMSAAAGRGAGGGGVERRKCLCETGFEALEQLVRPLHIVALERGA